MPDLRQEHYPSLLAEHVCLQGQGRWYYEVSILECGPDAEASFGWAVRTFLGSYERQRGVEYPDCLVRSYLFMLLLSGVMLQ